MHTLHVTPGNGPPRMAIFFTDIESLSGMKGWRVIEERMVSHYKLNLNKWSEAGQIGPTKDQPHTITGLLSETNQTKAAICQ